MCFINLLLNYLLFMDIYALVLGIRIRGLRISEKHHNTMLFCSCHFLPHLEVLIAHFSKLVILKKKFKLPLITLT